MATLFLISVVISLFGCKVNKQIKLDTYYYFSHDDRDYYLYGAATNGLEIYKQSYWPLRFFLSLSVFGKVEELQFVMRMEFYILQMENSIPFHGFF